MNEDSAYDDPSVFAAYTAAHVPGPHNPNHVMEAPAVWGELGEVTGLRVLDLGCGDARFGADLLAAGAASYHGVDGSRRMVTRARQVLTETVGSVEDARLEDHVPPARSAEVVTCRLAAHYLADLDAFLAGVRHALVDGGRFVMTMVHPVLSSHDTPSDGPRQHWVVDDYFRPGPRRRPWFGSEVTWHHRTVEQYHHALTAAGLTVRVLRECPPDPTRLVGAPGELDRRRRVPLFLLLGAVRTA